MGRLPAPPVDNPADSGGLVGVVLRGDAKEIDAAAAGCRLAGSRHRSLAVFAPQPLVLMSAALMAGIDPDRLKRDVILDQRRKIADLLRMAGVETKFSVTELKRRSAREAIHAAERSGCSILIVRGRQALDPRGARAIKAASIEIVDARAVSA